MNATEASANLGKDVHYIPNTLPTTVTRETRLPHGKLTKLMTSKTVQHGEQHRAVVNHETVLLPELIAAVDKITIPDHRAAYGQAYNRRKLVAAAEVDKLAALETDVDIIDDPLPPEEPEEVGK